MKLLNREEFLKLPEGTLYAKYEPHIFGGIQVKGESNKKCGDFYTMEMINPSYEGFNNFSDAIDFFNKSKQCELDFNCYGQDGLFDEDQLFAVFEAKELSKMIELLQTGLKLAISTENNNATP